MSNRNIALGRWGESIASEYLLEKGYTIIERNHRTEYGEIDLIAEYDGVIIFVEVKTRTGKKFGNPEEAITRQKTVHMIDSAQAFLQEHPQFAQEWRIDVIAIYQNKSSDSSEISHFENAVQG